MLDLPAASRREGGSPIAEEKAEAPFTIDYKNGIFIVTVFPSLKEDAVQSIQTALDKLSDREEQKFIQYINTIKQSDCAVCIVCSNLRLIRQLKSADEELFSVIYTDLTELVI